VKKAILAVCISVIAMVSTACTKVPAGYVGVKVYLTGGDKGVSSEVLGPGRYYIGYNEDLYPFPTFQQNYSWTANAHEGSSNDESFSLQTAEGQVVHCDIAITYSYDPLKISQLFQKFREGNDEIRDKQLHNFVRDAMNTEASKLLVGEIYGPKKIAFITAVEKEVRAEVLPEGINVEKISLIGAFRLPDALEKALNAKNEAIQKSQQIENEVASARAEAEKTVAQANGEARSILVRAEAQAKANRILANSLTRSLVEYEKVKRWNGQYPNFVSGGSANSIMVDTRGLSDYKQTSVPVAATGTDKTATTEAAE
jgi:regulator of protease activity HflC (stomatin/prohibitin superfamily)